MDLDKALYSSQLPHSSDMESKRPITPVLKIENLVISSMNYHFSSFEDLWDDLSCKIKVIFEGKCSSMDLNEMYTTMDQICKLGYQNEMYANLTALIDICVSNMIAPFLCFRETISQEFMTFWQFFVSISNILGKLNVVLERSYFSLENSKPLQNLSFAAFSNHLTQNEPLLNNIVNYALNYMKEMRDSMSINSKPITPLISMLIELKLYNKCFEPLLFDRTKAYYSTESESILRKPISEFLQISKERIQYEDEVICKIVSFPSIIRLSQIVRHECLGNFLDTHLLKGIYSLFDELKINDLVLLYTMSMQLVNGEAVLTNIVRLYIKARIADIIHKTSSNMIEKHVMIQMILDFHDKIFKSIMNAFGNNENMSKAIFSAFDNCLHLEPELYSVCLGEYIDHLMRNISNLYTEESFKIFLSSFGYMLKAVYNRDIFLSKYRNMLATRLIERKNCSLECEKLLSDEIKMIELGQDHASKVDGMFRDIVVSQELNLGFNECYKEGLETNIMLLSAGFWPTYDSSKLHLPVKMTKRIEEYDLYYHTKNALNRELIFPFQLGHCLVNIYYKNGKKQLEVGFFEALILDLLYIVPCYTVDNLIFQLGIRTRAYENELYNAIQTLACGNYRIIFKYPPGIHVSKTDTIKLNYDFTHPSFRIKIERFAPAKEAIDEPEKTSKAVFFENDLHIDALIVNFLKQHKSISKSNLLDLVKSKAKISIGPTELQDRINNLITREYAKINSEEPDIVQYSI